MHSLILLVNRHFQQSCYHPQSNIIHKLVRFKIMVLLPPIQAAAAAAAAATEAQRKIDEEKKKVHSPARGSRRSMLSLVTVFHPESRAADDRYDQ